MWNYVIILLTKYSFDWPQICRVLSKFFWDSYWISTKNSFGKFFNWHFKTILFLDFWNFAKVSAIFTRAHTVRKNPKKIHTSTFICCLHPAKEARPKTKKKTKRDMTRKTITFRFWKNKFFNFGSSRSETYYALFLGCFDMKVLPEVPYCVYWVVAKVSSLNSFHMICNKNFIQGSKERFASVYETDWFFFSNWILICST